MYPIRYFVDMYLDVFPDQRHAVEEHIKLNGMFLGHVFFDEEICGPLCRLLRRAQNNREVKELVGIIEAMLLEGDEYVQSIVRINILKKMQHERDLFDKAKPHFSQELMTALLNE